MTFKEAFNKYWDRNVFMKDMLIGVTMLAMVSFFAISIPTTFWYILLLFYVTIGITTFVNIKRIQYK